MAFQVRIPPLGESVTEGTITRWAKQDGETVNVDDVLLELETDKASMEIPSERGGVLKTLKPAGATVQVGDVVAEIDDAGAPRGAAPPASPARTVSSSASSSASASTSTVPAPAPAAKAPTAAPPPPGPAARHQAAERGIAVAAIAGTGKHGQVTKADVLAQAEAKSAPAPSASSRPSAPRPS